MIAPPPVKSSYLGVELTEIQPSIKPHPPLETGTNSFMFAYNLVKNYLEKEEVVSARKATFSVGGMCLNVIKMALVIQSVVTLPGCCGEQSFYGQNAEDFAILSLVGSGLFLLSLFWAFPDSNRFDHFVILRSGTHLCSCVAVLNIYTGGGDASRLALISIVAHFLFWSATKLPGIYNKLKVMTRIALRIRNFLCCKEEEKEVSYTDNFKEKVKHKDKLEIVRLSDLVANVWVKIAVSPLDLLLLLFWGVSFVIDLTFNAIEFSYAVVMMFNYHSMLYFQESSQSRDGWRPYYRNCSDYGSDLDIFQSKVGTYYIQSYCPTQNTTFYTNQTAPCCSWSRK